MAATTTPKISLIYNQLINDFHEISFIKESSFRWSPSNKTIYHPPVKTSSDLCQLLHEISHAELKHSTYRSDAALVDMELAAWKYAVEKLAPIYQVRLSIHSDIVEESLDSYREWLHSRSICPQCSAIGLEQSNQLYRCLSCQQNWQVNEARSCQLRRYKK